MLKEYAEFERKRKSGDDEKTQSARKSYSEFIKNNPTQEKVETTFNKDKTSSLPSVFQTSEKMREAATKAMQQSASPTTRRVLEEGQRINQQKQEEQRKMASLPAPFQYAQKAINFTTDQYETMKHDDSVVGSIADYTTKQNRLQQKREQILESAKNDKLDTGSLNPKDYLDTNNLLVSAKADSLRKKEIQDEYNYLDEETLAELRTIADGKDAEQLTSGLTGVQVAWASGEEYDKAYQRTIAGEEARKRLHNQGYSYKQIDEWAKMTQNNVHQQYNADWIEYAKEHPVIASVASVPQKFMVAPLNVASTIDGVASNDIKTNDLITTVTQSDKVMRQTVAEEIAEKSEFGAWLYNVGMSGVDSFVASTMPGGFLFLATDAATSTTRSLTEKGYGTGEAFFGGLAAGVFEGLFEKISIGNFESLQGVSPATVKDLVKNTLKSMGVNAQEEAATELANILYDSIVGGELSDYNLLVKEYEDQGMSPDEAKNKALDTLALQVLEAGAGGALMGIGFGAGGSAIGYTANYSDIKATGKRIKSYDGGVESAIETGKTAPEKSRPYKVAEKAQKKQSKGKELSDWGVGIIATEAMRYASENAPQLEGAFASAKTVDDVNRIYDAELDKLKSYPSTAKDLKTSIKHLDAQRSTALKSLTKYNSSGARMMVEGQPASIENLVKTKMPTIGKTDDGRVVSVSSADSVNDGVVTVKTSEGTTQTLDTQALTGKAKELWSYAADNFNDADAINAFVEGYDGGSIDTYSRLFKSTYQMASTGMTEAEIKKENLFNVNQLSQKAFSQAVSTGTKLANNKVGVLDVSTDIKSNSQKLTINMMDNFAKRHGLSIVVVDTLGGTEGKYKPSANQIVVALDASGGALNRVFGHETYHYLKQKNAMQAKQIEDFVFDTMTKLKGKEWVDNFIDKTYDKEIYKTDEARREDFVADQMFEVFANERAVKEFATKDASLLQKISAHIKSLIAEVKSILKKLVASGKYEDIAAWQEDLDSLQKLNDMVLDALANVEQTGNLTVQEKQAIDAFGDDLGQIETNADGDATLITNEDESVIVYSEVTWNNGGKGALEKALKRNGYNATEVADIIDSVDEIAAFLKDMSQNYADNMGYTLLAEHLAADVTMDVKNGKAVLHSIVNNGDYPVNIDLALNCKKRVAYMRVMRDLINNGIFEKVKYNGDAIAKVNEILRKNGFETACLGCFVESRRLQFQAWAETIVQEWNNAVDKYNNNAKYFGYAKVQKGASSLTVDEIIKIDQELSAAEKNEQGNVKLGIGAVATKMGKLLKMSPTLRQKITVADLLTPEGLTNLRRENPNLFSLVKSRYGAASPKIVQDYNPYSGEMANLSFARVKDITHNSIKGSSDYIKEAEQYLADSKPVQPKNTNATEYKQSKEYREWDEKVQTLAMRNYLYDIGGARMQSFSDFMIENVFDYVQIIADLAANKFPMHTYTKEIVMMRLFGMSGIKMNGPVICHTDPTLDQKYAGLLPASEAEKGNAILVHTEEGDFAIGFDDYARHALTKGTEEESYIQSIGFKDIIALQLDKRYSPYVGSITIGVSDLHIKAMLDSPLFRMVIPYHASGMLPQFAKLVGVDKYNDYTNYQNTTVKQCYGVNGKPVSRFKKGDKDLAIDTSYPFNAELQKVKDPKVAADNYIEWCAEKHPVYDGKTLVGYATFAPKFSNSPYGTDFSKHPNYYKLLEDFDVYDSVTEAYSEQGAVGMVFPSAENQLTEAELAEYRTRLEDTGVFSVKEIDKYVSRANMTFEEIIKAELDNRSLYESTQSKKYDATIKEISDTLVKDYSRSGQISSYKEFANTLKKGTTKQKEEQKGKLPLSGTYDASQSVISVETEQKFSTKRNTSISEDASNYIASTEEFQEAISILGERFELAGKVTLSPKAIDRLAGRLLDKSKSNYGREQLTERLTALFDYIANNRDVSWEEITTIAANISKDMLKESSVLDRSMQKEYSDVLDLMKGSKVYISPEVRQEIDYNFGSYDAFRRAMGNKLKVTVTDSSAVPLDVFWRELSEARPEMFDAEENALDMPSRLAEFFEMTAPQYVNPYDNVEMDMDEAAYDFALQMYDEYFNIPEVKTEARKYALKEERLKGKYNAKIKDIRKTYQDRIKNLRTEKNNKLEATKAYYREKHEAYREKRNETQDKQRLRASIVRTSKKLVDKLVKPTDQKHIPQELISSVNEFAKAITESGVFTPDRAMRLKQAFKAIGENGTDADANLSTMYNEEFAEMFEKLQDTIAGRRLTELNSSELETVRDTIKYVAHVVSMSNRAFSDGVKERLGVLQNDALEEFSKQNPDRKRVKFEIQKGLLKPVTFFELIESPTMMKLYENIRQGESKWYNTIASAKKRRQDAADKFNYKSWKKDTITIKPERFGGNVVLSVDEALSIYATANRQQGVDHLLLGGIVREEDAKKKLDRKKKTESVDVRSDNIPLTIKDISEITSKLTKEQRGYADNLVEYMSTDMASLGNEVSMRLFGIKKFNEQKYFPLKSASNFLFSKPAVESDARIKHMSMTKPTTPKANNPVIIGNFTETVMNHCNDMALYYSFCLPLEDFNRVYNFKTQPTTFERPTSIKQKIDAAYGSKANSYIKQLLTDINGGVTQQAGTGFVNKMIAKAKKNAVFGSLSVAVQQPSAIARAFLYVDPKYFVSSTFNKRDWNELKKYAPVAGVKEMGYFDTNVGKQAVDWMSEDGYDGLKEKAFALFKDKDYRDDKLSFLPSYMDRITWGHIWNAVKKETAHNNPNMDVKSEEFLTLAGKRFTFVIDRTQVYDSVFARSEWMRSKDTGVKVATAFMSEPLTNYNMLYSAAVKARHGDVKFGTKAVSAYLVSVAFNSLLKSLVTAGRDDDEDKSYWEKYLSHIVGGFVDEPFGMIPYLKDFVSLLQGYDSKRMDTQALADIADAVMTIFNDNKSGWEKFKSAFGAVGIAAGIPFKNLIRDGEMIYRGVKDIFDGKKQPTTEKGIEYAIKEELGFDVPTKYDQIIEAYLERDESHYEKVNNNLKASKSDSAISSGIKTAVKNKYQAGAITEVQATVVLQELLGYDENKAYWTIDEWSSEEGDYAKYNDFSEAVRSGKNLNDVIAEYLDHGVTKKTLASQITKTFKKEYVELYRTDRAEASALRRRILDAYVELGYDRDDKADDITDWLEENK